MKYNIFLLMSVVRVLKGISSKYWSKCLFKCDTQTNDHVHGCADIYPIQFSCNRCWVNAWLKRNFNICWYMFCTLSGKTTIWGKRLKFRDLLNMWSFDKFLGLTLRFNSNVPVFLTNCFAVRETRLSYY